MSLRQDSPLTLVGRGGYNKNSKNMFEGTEAFAVKNSKGMFMESRPGYYEK